MLKSPISPLADFRIFGYFLLLVSALVILIPSFHKYSIELFTLMGTMFVVVIGAWRIRVMYAFYIILIICPFLQGRSLFGIYGLNASNLIFLLILMNFLFVNLFHKSKSNYQKIKVDIFPWILALFVFQLMWVLRLIYNNSYYAGNFAAIMQEFFKPLQIYIFIYLIHKSIISFKDSKILIYAVVIGMAIQVIILSWYYLILGIDPESEMIWSKLFLGHKNVFAIIVAQMALFALSFSVNNKKGMLILTFFSVLILMYTNAITAWIAFAVAAIFLLYKGKNKIIRTLYFIGGIALILFFYDLIADRVEFGLSQLNPNFYYMPTYRLGVLYTQIQGIISNPIMGGGFKYAAFGHNGFLTTWNKLGIFGLLISIIIIYKMYKTLNYNFKNIKNNYHNTLSLFGLSIIIMIPIINMTNSFQLTDSNDLAGVMVLFIIYIISTRKVLIKRGFN